MKDFNLAEIYGDVLTEVRKKIVTMFFLLERTIHCPLCLVKINLMILN